MPHVNHVAGIRRYPLKSAAAEHVGEVRIGRRGLDGDRTWACLDADGTVGSGKQPKLWAGLLEVSATYTAAQGDPEVQVSVPGAASAAAGSAEAEQALSAWLGRPIRLTRTVPPQLKRHHWWPDEPGMIPEWAADTEPGSEEVLAVGGAADGRFFDFGPLHLVTTGALRRLSEEHGAEVDPIRFRPNLILDLPEDPEPGTHLTIGGDVILETSVPTPRCVIPSLAHGGSSADPSLLKTLARHHRMEVPGYGRATCFGFYAVVVAEGTVRTGDQVARLS
jgi:MOSC domain-containing protein